MIDVVVDLSHWQSTVDFPALWAAGTIGVILKATQGVRYIDPTFVSRVALATNAGLLVGAYHFCDGNDPGKQAAHFLSVAGRGIPLLALDIEPNSIGSTVTVPLAAEIASLVQMASGKLPVIYMGRYGPDGNGGGLPNKVLGRCPLWIAAYNNRSSPILPLGWPSWRLWQYTETGSLLPGVDGPVDRNRFDGSADELRAWWENPTL